MTTTTTPSPIEILNASRPEAPPVNVEKLARDLGLIVFHVSNLGPDIAGKIMRDARRMAPAGYAIYVNGNDNPRRQRFTIAHEIAHYVLHRDLIGDGITDSATDGALYRSSLGDDYERQANRLAADVLMPAQLVRAYYRGGVVSYAQLAEAFDVSIDAIRIRLQELRLG